MEPAALKFVFRFMVPIQYIIVRDQGGQNYKIKIYTSRWRINSKCALKIEVILIEVSGKLEDLRNKSLESVNILIYVSVRIGNSF